MPVRFHVVVSRLLFSIPENCNRNQSVTQESEPLLGDLNESYSYTSNLQVVGFSWFSTYMGISTHSTKSFSQHTFRPCSVEAQNPKRPMVSGRFGFLFLILSFIDAGSASCFVRNRTSRSSDGTPWAEFYRRTAGLFLPATSRFHFRSNIFFVCTKLPIVICVKYAPDASETPSSHFPSQTMEYVPASLYSLSSVLTC